MASLAEKKIGIRRELRSLLGSRSVSIGSLRDEDRDHISATHLPDLNKIILDYYAPQRASNTTALVEDELSEYISFLENKNSSLSLRLAELERKFKAIEPYLPYIPTLAKIVSDYAVAEARVEKKKKYLREKYSVKEAGKIKLWTGAEEKVDIADTTLDEMLGNIDE